MGAWTPFHPKANSHEPSNFLFSGRGYIARTSGYDICCLGFGTKLCTTEGCGPSIATKPDLQETGGTASGATRYERHPVTLSSAFSVSSSVKPRDRGRRDESLRCIRRSHWDRSLDKQIVGRYQGRGDRRHRLDSRDRRRERRRRAWNFHRVAPWSWRGWHNFTMFMCVVGVGLGMSMVMSTADLVLLWRWGRFV